MITECPKCGFSQPIERFCPSCGVDTQRYAPKTSLLGSRKRRAFAIFCVTLIASLVVLKVLSGKNFSLFKDNNRGAYDEGDFFAVSVDDSARQAKRVNAEIDDTEENLAATVSEEASEAIVEEPASLTTETIIMLHGEISAEEFDALVDSSETFESNQGVTAIIMASDWATLKQSVPSLKVHNGSGEILKTSEEEIIKSYIDENGQLGFEITIQPGDPNSSPFQFDIAGQVNLLGRSDDPQPYSLRFEGRYYVAENAVTLVAGHLPNRALADEEKSGLSNFAPFKIYSSDSFTQGTTKSVIVFTTQSKK